MMKDEFWDFDDIDEDEFIKEIMASEPIKEFERIEIDKNVSAMEEYYRTHKMKDVKEGN